MSIYQKIDLETNAYYY